MKLSIITLVPSAAAYILAQPDPTNYGIVAPSDGHTQDIHDARPFVLPVLITLHSHSTYQTPHLHLSHLGTGVQASSKSPERTAHLVKNLKLNP
ncbi:hypothetical protein Moror_13208 [Moniliophthora roreri MCA 2997]|uniref:Uncharacterized protein n=1 Tax=Moniliophthora roreri (strain MCA 2997) TaxID=1381753 RepID=V2X807_MONRO|nr:hypothetical protein Moror_13208 [Moniliophthora roreri MCA 2997]